MKVFPVLNELLRYRVQSEKNPRKYYLVELDADLRKAICDCPHWQIRVSKLNEDDFQKEPRLCKHQEAALRCFAVQMLQRIAKATGAIG